MSELLSVEEAQAAALAVARPSGQERVAVRAALARVLAEDVTAPGDVPPHDNSAMDGYAVRAGDLGANGGELGVAGEIAAGHPATRSLSTGEAYAIMTGAPMPPGADAVVMVEHTTRAGDRVRIDRAVTVGDHVRRAGDDIRAGQVVLRAGTTLGPAELGVLASARRAQVRVARRPEVAVLATGDELRDVDQPLDPGAVADTNSYALAALVEAAGARARVLPIVRDDRALLAAAIEEARAADAIVSSGGVSVGEHDHIKAVLAELGATLSLWRVNMKPGKPVAIATLPGPGGKVLGAVPFFGLPGNPVSTMVSFLLFVRPALRRALGCAQPLDLPRVEAALEGPLRSKGDRVSFLRARVRTDERGRLVAAPRPQQGSHVLTSMVGANALIVLEPGTHELAAGAPVRALLFAPIAAC